MGATRRDVTSGVWESPLTLGPWHQADGQPLVNVGAIGVRLWPQLLPLCPIPLSQVSPCHQLLGRLSMLNLQWSPVVKEIPLIGCLAKYEKRNYKTLKPVVMVSMIHPFRAGSYSSPMPFATFYQTWFLIRSGYGSKNTVVCISTALSHPVSLMNVDHSYLVDREGYFCSG